MQNMFDLHYLFENTKCPLAEKKAIQKRKEVVRASQKLPCYWDLLFTLKSSNYFAGIHNTHGYKQATAQCIIFI